jgi:hypothetical protein
MYQRCSISCIHINAQSSSPQITFHPSTTVKSSNNYQQCLDHINIVSPLSFRTTHVPMLPKPRAMYCALTFIPLSLTVGQYPDQGTYLGPMEVGLVCQVFATPSQGCRHRVMDGVRNGWRDRMECGIGSACVL